MEDEQEKPQKPAVKTKRRNQRPIHALPEVSEVDPSYLISSDGASTLLNRWLIQLVWGYSQEEIDPDYLRQVYIGVERLLAIDKAGMLGAAFNAEKSHFHLPLIFEKKVNCDVLYIAPRKLLRGKTKSLKGKFGLLQIIEKSESGEPIRLLAWGEFEEPDASDDMVYFLKICSEPEFAEMYHGLSIAAQPHQILHIAKAPVKFNHDSVPIVEW